MSCFIHPCFDIEVTASQSSTTGEVLASSLTAVDDFATERDIPGLSTFADSRDIPEDFDGSPGELLDIMGPCEDWYSCQEGSSSLLVLAEAIAAEPNRDQLFEDVDQLVEELMDLARILKSAEGHGARFRLDMSC